MNFISDCIVYTHTHRVHRIHRIQRVHTHTQPRKFNVVCWFVFRIVRLFIASSLSCTHCLISFAFNSNDMKPIFNYNNNYNNDSRLDTIVNIYNHVISIQIHLHEQYRYTFTTCIRIEYNDVFVSICICIQIHNTRRILYSVLSCKRERNINEITKIWNFSVSFSSLYISNQMNTQYVLCTLMHRHSYKTRYIKCWEIPI